MFFIVTSVIGKSSFYYQSREFKEKHVFSFIKAVNSFIEGGKTHAELITVFNINIFAGQIGDCSDNIRCIAVDELFLNNLSPAFILFIIFTIPSSKDLSLLVVLTVSFFPLGENKSIK